MSQNAGIIGKLTVGAGTVFLMIGKCAATLGDDVVRLGARSVDDFAVVSTVGDDMFRAGDDLLMYSDDLIKRTGDDVIHYSDEIIRATDESVTQTVLSTTEEVASAFDDLFLEVAQHSAEWILENTDTDEENIEIKNNILDDFDLGGIQSIVYGGYHSQRYEFDAASREGFLTVLMASQPIEKISHPDAKAIKLEGNPAYWAVIGKDYIGIRRNEYVKFKYYSLKMDLTKAFN